MSKPHQVKFTFHRTLNDFLDKQLRNQPVRYDFSNKPTVKDAIEALGVPHVEVYAISINAEPANFDCHLFDGQGIEVFDHFSASSKSQVGLLRKDPVNLKFILDVHLGQLARFLRMFGLDTFYTNHLGDPAIIEVSNLENRVILTRDIGLLKHGDTSYGYWIRSDQPKEQLKEIFSRFDLSAHLNPMSRCLECNGLIQSVDKAKVAAQLPPVVRKEHAEIYQCEKCQKLYWKGSHFKRMLQFIDEIKN